MSTKTEIAVWWWSIMTEETHAFWCLPLHLNTLLHLFIFIISSFGFSTLTNMNLIKHVILFTHLVDGAYFFVCFRYWVKINIDRYERL